MPNVKQINFQFSIFNFQLSLIILALILPIFSLAQVEAPETIEEAKGFVERFTQKTIELLPQALEKTWKENVLPIWKKIFEGIFTFWNSYIQPWLENIWQKFLKILGKEIEKRKPVIEKELQKEKEELKEKIKKETEKTKESLWERFKDLIE